MPNSGIAINDEVIKVFNEMKKDKKIHYIKYIIDKEALVIKEIKRHDEEFDVQNDLPNIFDPDQCCYVVVDLKFQNTQGGEREKLMFVSWAPDTARVKDKMMHSTTQENFVAKLVGIFAKVQATDASEITFQSVLSVAQQKLTSK